MTPADKIAAAERAIGYLLNRSLHSNDLYYQIGRGTEAFRLLTHAHAALAELPVEDVEARYGR